MLFLYEKVEDETQHSWRHLVLEIVHYLLRTALKKISTYAAIKGRSLVLFVCNVKVRNILSQVCHFPSVNSLVRPILASNWRGIYRSALPTALMNGGSPASLTLTFSQGVHRYRKDVLAQA